MASFRSRLTFFPWVSTSLNSVYSLCCIRRGSGYSLTTGPVPVYLPSLSGLYGAHTECIDFNHRVDRVLSFLSSRPNWDFPTHSHAGEYVPPPFSFRGGHTRLPERGWGVPIPTMGQTLWYSRYTVYELCDFNNLIMLTRQWMPNSNRRPIYEALFSPSGCVWLQSLKKCQ